MVGMGGMFYIIAAGGSAKLTSEDPGLTKLLASFLFPVALIFIVLTGAELVTSNFMYMTILVFERKITFVQLIINWVSAFLCTSLTNELKTLNPRLVVGPLLFILWLFLWDEGKFLAWPMTDLISGNELDR